jgi:uncharacterized protein
MISRIKEQEIRQLLKQFPVVAIVGPRQCGKTTIAKIIRSENKNASYYFDLESPADFSRFEDPEYFLQSLEAERIIIDEVQRKPELFTLLRSLVDKNKKKGKYLLLGSASPHLVKGVSETLAGRIAYSEVSPFNLVEVYKKQADLNKLWFRGGFPDAWLSRSESIWFTWMDNFFRTFIERDLNTLFGVNFSAPLMYKLWRMLAHYHGQPWNAETFSKALDVSPPTVNKYMDYLEGSYMIRRLPAYFTNGKKKILKAPKIFIRDSGLLHYLLDISKSKEVIFNPGVGFSWEGFAIEQILQLVPPHIKAYFYRTYDGSEMDLLLVRGLKPIACIELKTTNNPKVSRGFFESINDLKCSQNFIVTPFQEINYKMDKTTTVCGLKDFLSNFLPKILRPKTSIKK